MALVDSQYMFLFVDVGAQGITSDGGVFRGTELYEALEGGYAGLPQPEPLPGDDYPLQPDRRRCLCSLDLDAEALLLQRHEQETTHFQL